MRHGCSPRDRTNAYNMSQQKANRLTDRPFQRKARLRGYGATCYVAPTQQLGARPCRYTLKSPRPWRALDERDVCAPPSSLWHCSLGGLLWAPAQQRRSAPKTGSTPVLVPPTSGEPRSGSLGSTGSPGVPGQRPRRAHRCRVRLHRQAVHRRRPTVPQRVELQRPRPVRPDAAVFRRQRRQTSGPSAAAPTSSGVSRPATTLARSPRPSTPGSGG